MRHIIFQEAPKYEAALLIKGTAFNQYHLETNYLRPLQAKGISPDQLIAFTLEYTDSNKAPVKVINEYLSKLLPALDSLGVKFLYVADSNYFKVLAKKPKAEPHIGYAVPCGIKGFEHMQVVLGLNYQALTYDPTQLPKLNLSLEALARSLQGTYQGLGNDVIRYSEFPETLEEIHSALAKLHQYPELTCDIEGFSLAFNAAGIATIGFAWNQHEGISFACDYQPFLDPQDVAETGLYGYQETNHAVRALIREFLEKYQGTLTYHNASYDIRSIIYALWMRDLKDTQGLLYGLDLLTRSFHDTQIITYLATNTTAGNELGLKKQAHEFAGNYAQDDEDIKDVRRIPLKDLLTYNLVDCLCTWFTKNKHYPTMVRDNQEQLYFDMFLPSLKVIIQMELTGMPMEATRVQEAKAELERQAAEHEAVILSLPLIKVLEDKMTQEDWEADFESRRSKAKHPENIKPKDWDTYPRSVFNPNSGPQLQKLLYGLMELPVIDLTETKQPATGADTLEKLINHTQDPSYKEVIQALIGHGKVSKILSAFIPSFEAALDKGDGRVWLHGGFNLGGTVSGRLSSSKPNMQQIPSGSTFGKLIKGCFSAPKGWLFTGADFSSLEDYISALTTKDPNKLVIYEQGLDSHTYRAIAYFGDQMPGVQLSKGRRVFQVRQDDICLNLFEGDIVELPDGSQLPIEDYYAAYRSP